MKAVNGASGHTIWVRVFRATVDGAWSGRRLVVSAVLGVVSLLLCSGLVFGLLAPLSDVSQRRPEAGARSR